ncbi:MAG: hypothetical protein D6737_18360, partial [Chloroflexi bacterium]
DAKIEAIACYRSQISTFWEDVDDMAHSTRMAMTLVGEGTPAERYWRVEQDATQNGGDTGDTKDAA